MLHFWHGCSDIGRCSASELAVFFTPTAQAFFLRYGDRGEVKQADRFQWVVGTQVTDAARDSRKRLRMMQQEYEIIGNARSLGLGRNRTGQIALFEATSG